MKDDIVLEVPLQVVDMNTAANLPSHLRLHQPVEFPVGFSVDYVVYKDGRRALHGRDGSRHAIR
jgi:hypothetical protein